MIELQYAMTEQEFLCLVGIIAMDEPLEGPTVVDHDACVKVLAEFIRRATDCNPCSVCGDGFHHWIPDTNYHCMHCPVFTEDDVEDEDRDPEDYTASEMDADASE